MKDYLEKRREELSKRDGGFTLMEMLIVVAIIAVLIAIAIPVFTSQLENARDSTSVANIRSAYATAQAAYLTEDDSDANVTFEKDAATKKVTSITVDKVKIESQQANNWSNKATELPFDASSLNDEGTPGDKKIKFTYGANNAITVAWA
ncbi:MAG: prepilin-type N-terminal cleavage/methylation domain-containing protein [Atopobiaceae bacterium]|nr:prepilin-type N-terminal cleavage/methylation domain-containing protein [Atopobiaceae bacterium]